MDEAPAPKKCKVVSVSSRAPPLLGILPCIQYFYSLGENPLDYVDSERDLGVEPGALGAARNRERVQARHLLVGGKRGGVDPVYEGGGRLGRQVPEEVQHT